MSQKLFPASGEVPTRLFTQLLFVCPAAVPPGNPIIEARDEVLSEGNETEMTCSAMSSKPAAAIRWMKGDKELPGTPPPSVMTFSPSAEPSVLGWRRG